jgi:hypothetical protein
MTGGAFGPRKDTCKHGHSLEDAYVYKRIYKNKIYTIRECKPCSKLRDKEARKRNPEAKRLSDRAYYWRNKEKLKRTQKEKRLRKKGVLPPKKVSPPKSKRLTERPEAIGLDCGHEMLFNPKPKDRDIVWCMTCKGYRIAVLENKIEEKK